MKIAVIGAGPAGIAAALAAHKAGAMFVTLFSREPVLPFARPKLPEAAFSDGDVLPFAYHSKAWYAQNGIELRLDTPVTSLDAEARVIKTLDGEEFYDAYVIAGGANPLKPIIPGLMASPSLFTLWSYDDARRISRNIRRGRRMAVVGGGILGIDTALRAAKAGKEVILMEKGARLMESRLDKDASDFIVKLLESKGVEVRTNTSIISGQQIASKMCLKLEGETKTLDVDMTVLTVGAKANLSLAQSAGIAVDRGICVDETMQTSASNVYAAGDAVQFGLSRHCCEPSAIEQGRIAGYNAVQAVSGGEPVICPTHEFPLRHYGSEIQVHVWGQTTERSINAKVVKMTGGMAGAKKGSSVRLKVVRPDGVVAGVQMVGTDVGFDESLPGNK